MGMEGGDNHGCLHPARTCSHLRFVLRGGQAGKRRAKGKNEIIMKKINKRK